jgi:hypothetical protein
MYVIKECHINIYVKFIASAVENEDKYVLLQWNGCKVNFQFMYGFYLTYKKTNIYNSNTKQMKI